VGEAKLLQDGSLKKLRHLTLPGVSCPAWMMKKCLFLLIRTVSPTCAHAVADRVFWLLETYDFHISADRAVGIFESSPTHTQVALGANTL
jgi:hypothetical protein